MSEPIKSDYTPWQACNGYVYKRHMLKHASLEGGRLVVDACKFAEPITCNQALEWVYELLSALDAKASALMRLNGVMLAAAAFLLSMHSTALTQSIIRVAKWDVVLLTGTAMLSAISILLCLLVVNVQWYFLGRVTDAGGKLDYTDEFEMLQKVGHRRQRHYRFAWQISRVAALGFVLEFVRQFVFSISGWSPW